MDEPLISLADLKIEPWPPREKGGQHVSTVSGIRITHLPSGIEAVCTTDRSQFRNRAIAMDMIEAALTSPHYR